MNVQPATETVVKKILPYLQRRQYNVAQDLNFNGLDRYSQGYVDILVNCDHAPKPQFLIGASRFPKKLTLKDRDETIEYGSAISVPFVALTNGLAVQCFNTNTRAPLRWNGSLDGYIPTKKQLPSVLKTFRADSDVEAITLGTPAQPDQSLPFRPGLPLKKLNALFKRCHDAIREIEKDEQHAFADFSKLLFLKLLEEKWDDGEIELPYPYRFHELARAPKRETEQIRDQVREMIAKIQADTPFGEVLSDDVHLRHPKTFRYIVTALSEVSFRDSSADTKGASFEYFVRATLKGKRLGQYFTPRPLVELMIAMIGDGTIVDAVLANKKPRVLDPACGTGGFLVYGMRHSLADLTRRMSDGTISPRAYKTAKRRIMGEVFYGSEATSGVACAAKMNMIIAGDGHTNIRAENSLARAAENWSPIGPPCDIILTNPPFGTSETQSLTANDMSLCPIPGSKGQHLFLQRMVLATTPGGDICTVIDEGVLNTESMRDLRTWLMKQCQVVAIVRLPDETFKPNKINVKSSILYLKRRPQPDVMHFTDEPITFCDLETLGYYGSGEPIRGIDMAKTHNEVAVRVRHQSKTNAGSGWSAFSVSAREVRKDPGVRLDYKYWNPAIRDGITKLRNAPDSAFVNELVTREPWRGRSPSADCYVDERDGYAMVIKAGASISKLGTLIEEGEDIDFVEKDVFDQLSSAHVQTGDVLLASTGEGTLGKCCVFRSTRPAIAESHVTILRVDPAKVVPDYLCDYLRAGFGAQQIQRQFSGSTGIIELTTKHINAILVDLLGGDLVAQKRVSDALRAGEIEAVQRRRDAVAIHTGAVREFLNGPSITNGTHRPAEQFVDAVTRVIRERCATLSDVAAAWVKPDGTDFILTGEIWTPELSEVGADLVIELRDKFAPTCEPLIEGGYMDGVRPVEGWVKVYP
jgi:type I restriction enzyme M protein